MPNKFCTLTEIIQGIKEAYTEAHIPADLVSRSRLEMEAMMDRQREICVSRLSKFLEPELRETITHHQDGSISIRLGINICPGMTMAELDYFASLVTNRIEMPPKEDRYDA